MSDCNTGFEHLVCVVDGNCVYFMNDLWCMLNPRISCHSSERSLISNILGEIATYWYSIQSQIIFF